LLDTYKILNVMWFLTLGRFPVEARIGMHYRKLKAFGLGDKIIPHKYVVGDHPVICVAVEAREANALGGRKEDVSAKRSLTRTTTTIISKDMLQKRRSMVFKQP
jgi:hypothetical protein